MQGPGSGSLRRPGAVGGFHASYSFRKYLGEDPSVRPADSRLSDLGVGTSGNHWRTSQHPAPSLDLQEYRGDADLPPRVSCRSIETRGPRALRNDWRPLPQWLRGRRRRSNRCLRECGWGPVQQQAGPTIAKRRARASWARPEPLLQPPPPKSPWRLFHSPDISAGHPVLLADAHEHTLIDITGAQVQFSGVTRLAAS